jgi:hypothetical protein
LTQIIGKTHIVLIDALLRAKFPTQLL